MSALEDNMLLILNIIISLTAVAHCGRHVILSSCLIAKGLNTLSLATLAESESGNAANDIKGEVKDIFLGTFQIHLKRVKLKLKRVNHQPDR